MKLHLIRYWSVYLKGICLLLAQLAAAYVSAVNSITAAQWAAMDSLHRSGFFAGLIGGGAVLIAAFLSQDIATAKANPSPEAPKIPTAPIAAAALIALCLFGLTGCASTSSQTIEAATTTLKVTGPNGQSFAIAFPKELTASVFNLNVDPSSGKVAVTANQIQTSSTQIIQQAGVAADNALATMAQANAQMTNQAASFVAKVAPVVATAVPSTAPVAAAVGVAASAIKAATAPSTPTPPPNEQHQPPVTLPASATTTPAPITAPTP